MVKRELDMQLKNKVVSIMQPTYLPWLGYFHLINLSDIFVIYNNTQLVKRSWQTRNRIKTANGELFLTIPIKKTEERDKLKIKKAEINYSNIDWRHKHLMSINQAYKKAPFFESIYPIIEEFYKESPKYLVDLTIPIIVKIIDLLKIKTKIMFSDEIKFNGNKDDALISICKNLGAEKYLSVKGSMDYILADNNLFEKNKIELKWHNFSHPEYKQVHGDFVPKMGVIDTLFNIGIDETALLIRDIKNE